MHKSDAQLQAEMILEPTVPLVAQPAASHVAQPKEQPQPRRTSSRRISTAYDKAGTTVAYAGAMFLAGLLWYLGAFFTLTFLQTQGLEIQHLGLVAWLVPLGITAIELWLMPRTGTRWQSVLVFLAVLAFDVGTSWSGAITWGAGKHIALFNGFTLPKAGLTLHALALVLGLVFAFLPEKIGRWAAAELWHVWR